MPTDWTLAVIMEAYWAYALYAWLATAAGVRSRRFAMWSASGVFILSLAGQSAARLVGVKPMTAFANGMPVIVLALIAILVHLRQLDRADTAAAEEAARRDERARAEEAAATDERTALRAELDALAAEVEPLREALAEAERRESEALKRVETLTQKVAALSAKIGTSKPPKGKRVTAHADDLTTEFRAFELLRDNPALRAPRMGAELGRKLGASDATGRRLHSRLIVNGQLVQPLTEPLSERSADRSDERS